MITFPFIFYDRVWEQDLLFYSQSTGYDWTRDAGKAGVWIGWKLAARPNHQSANRHRHPICQIRNPDLPPSLCINPVHPRTISISGRWALTSRSPIRSVRSKAAKQQIMGGPSLCVLPSNLQLAVACVRAFPRTFRPFWPQTGLLRTQSTCLRLYDNIRLSLAF